MDINERTDRLSTIRAYTVWYMYPTAVEQSGVDRMLFDDEMDAPVFLSALDGMLHTQRAIFSVTGCRDVYGETKFQKVGFHIPGSTLPQHEIVRRCAEFVAAPFEEKKCHPVVLQLLGISF